MTFYKGYYIDNVYFHSKQEIDRCIKKQAIESFKRAVQVFMTHTDIAHSIYTSNLADRLHNVFGMSYDEIEQIEIETMKGVK